jgi:hypothetical protein
MRRPADHDEIASAQKSKMPRALLLTALGFRRDLAPESGAPPVGQASFTIFAILARGADN